MGNNRLALKMALTIACVAVGICFLWNETNFSDVIRGASKDDLHRTSLNKYGINDLEGGYVQKVDGFEAFCMNGTDITLPISLKDFTDAGFYLKEDDLKEIIEAHNSYSYPYYRSKDDECLGTIFIYNTSNMDSKVKSGIVGGLTINNRSDMDLTVVGGLVFGSSPEAAVKVLGSDVTEVYKDGDHSYYMWQFTHGYATSIELDYNRNKLDKVWIMNYASLSDY